MDTPKTVNFEPVKTYIIGEIRRKKKGGRHSVKERLPVFID